MGPKFGSRTSQLKRNFTVTMSDRPLARWTSRTKSADTGLKDLPVMRTFLVHIILCCFVFCMQSQTTVTRVKAQFLVWPFFPTCFVFYLDYALSLFVSPSLSATISSSSSSRPPKTANRARVCERSDRTLSFDTTFLAATYSLTASSCQTGGSSSKKSLAIRTRRWRMRCGTLRRMNIRCVSFSLSISH